LLVMTEIQKLIMAAVVIGQDKVKLWK
jgi:hypothetical protein